MKKYFWILPLITVFFLAQSCLKDDEEESVNYYETMAFVTIAGDKPSFMTDYGISLKSELSLASDTGDVFDLGQRVFMVFSYGDTLNLVNNVYPIIIKEYAPVTVSDFKTVKPDSVNPYYDQILYHVYRFYITQNYFNSIIYTYQPLTSINTCELIRVMENENNTPDSEFPTVNFEIRHNASAVNYDYYKLRLFSHDLSPLAVEFANADSIKLKLRWNESTSLNQTHEFIYKPTGTGLRQEIHKYGNLKFQD